ncbi:hypothetical protein [Terriglobus sp. ADX1]|uniref:hypothetical protein n=1 Tax=Terriglobus sp. ADX1 TaxID=2794063 RepID=UPI002FE5702D
MNQGKERHRWLDIATFLAVAGATVFSGYQALLSRESLGLTRDSFIKDQRPYVLAKQVAPYKGDGVVPLTFNVGLTNYGKSPALHKVSQDRVFLGDAAEQNLDKFFDTLTPSQTIPPTGSDVTIPSNASATCPKEEDGAVGASDFSCVFSTVSPQDTVSELEAAIQMKRRKVFIAGRIYYQDMSGNAYRTDYCFSPLGNGAISACPKHNEVH